MNNIPSSTSTNNLPLAADGEKPCSKRQKTAGRYSSTSSADAKSSQTATKTSEYASLLGLFKQVELIRTQELDDPEHKNRVIKLIEAHLKTFPNADINIAHTEGPLRGITLLSLAAEYAHWPLVNTMLDTHPKPNCNAPMQEGLNHNKTPLWSAAYGRCWSIAAKMMKKDPLANPHTAPTKGHLAGVSALTLALDPSQSACPFRGDFIMLARECLQER